MEIEKVEGNEPPVKAGSELNAGLGAPGGLYRFARHEWRRLLTQKRRRDFPQLVMDEIHSWMWAGHLDPMRVQWDEIYAIEKALNIVLPVEH